MRGIERQRHSRQDDNAVDRYAALDRGVARGGHLPAGIVGAVARDIDHLALRSIRCSAQGFHPRVDCSGDGGAPVKRSRGLDNGVGEFLRLGLAAYARPVDDDFRFADTGPFNEDEADAPLRSRRLHCLDDERIGDCRCVTVALQLELVVVDAARDVGCQHKQQIDVLLDGKRGRCADDRRRDDHAATEREKIAEPDADRHTHTSTVALSRSPPNGRDDCGKRCGVRHANGKGALAPGCPAFGQKP